MLDLIPVAVGGLLLAALIFRAEKYIWPLMFAAAAGAIVWLLF